MKAVGGMTVDEMVKELMSIDLPDGLELTEEEARELAEYAIAQEKGGEEEE